jgi:hypothetical protein
VVGSYCSASTESLAGLRPLTFSARPVAPQYGRDRPQEDPKIQSE